MFRWCSYCQHLAGEAPPLQDYRLTHGICERCEATLDSWTPTRELLVARGTMDELEEAGREGDVPRATRAVDRALKAGLRPSEVLVGVLHPALGRVGDLWERGEMTVAEEHRFTAFALEVLARLPPPPPESERPSLLLALLPGNEHDVGVRMISYLARERGLSCRLLPGGTSVEAIAEVAAASVPALLGISASVVESLPDALELWRRLQRDLPPEIGLALGGHAFRRDANPSRDEGAPVLRSLDELVAALDGISRGSSRH